MEYPVTFLPGLQNSAEFLGDVELEITPERLVLAGKRCYPPRVILSFLALLALGMLVLPSLHASSAYILYWQEHQLLSNVLAIAGALLVVAIVGWLAIHPWRRRKVIARETMRAVQRFGENGIVFTVTGKYSGLPRRIFLFAESGQAADTVFATADARNGTLRCRMSVLPCLHDNLFSLSQGQGSVVIEKNAFSLIGQQPTFLAGLMLLPVLIVGLALGSQPLSRQFHLTTSQLALAQFVIIFAGMMLIRLLTRAITKAVRLDNLRVAGVDRCDDLLDLRTLDDRGITTHYFLAMATEAETEYLEQAIRDTMPPAKPRSVVGSTLLAYVRTKDIVMPFVAHSIALSTPTPYLHLGYTAASEPLIGGWMALAGFLVMCSGFCAIVLLRKWLAGLPLGLLMLLCGMLLCISTAKPNIPNRMASRYPLPVALTRYRISYLQNRMKIHQANGAPIPENIPELQRAWHLWSQQLIDAWNQPICYQKAKTGTMVHYRISSAGPDGVHGNADDITTGDIRCE